MSICSDKSSYFYKSRLCESIRSFRKTKKIWIFIYILVVVLFFIGLEQDRSFSSYIPTGLFYTTLDILLPIIILFIVISLQKKEYPAENEYGERPWYYRQSLNTRKLLRFLKNTLLGTMLGGMVYYSMGSLASKFPQQYTYNTYTVKVTSLFGRGHGGCKRSIKTDFLDQINLENPSLYVNVVKKLNLLKLCMNYNTYGTMYKNKKITILTQESPIWGIYIKSLDFYVPNTDNKKHYKSTIKPSRPIEGSSFNEKLKTNAFSKKENNTSIQNIYPKKRIVFTPNKS